MKKEIGIGFLVGIISNSLGVLVCVWIISMIKKFTIESTFDFYYQSENLWMLLTLGALPNLAVFFGFLKINREYRARGVLLATFMTAIVSYLNYFL